jgi:hypothetical protein
MPFKRSAKLSYVPDRQFAARPAPNEHTSKPSGGRPPRAVPFNLPKEEQHEKT